MSFKTLLIAVMSLVAMATMAQETATKTAYAVWCGGNNTLYFLTSEEALNDGGTFTLGSEELTITNQWSGPDVTATGSYAPKWKDVKGSIKHVVFDESFKEVKPTSCDSWFYGCAQLTTIDGISNLNTESVTNMSFMFANCSSLAELDLSSFDTKSVKDMSAMFLGCSSLFELNLSNFNTASVRTMNDMFSGCGVLFSLDLSSFNTEKVENMKNMFLYCRGLSSLDLSSFNTEKVENMENMFLYCRGLSSLDLSSFKTASVKYMSDMFTACDALKTIDLCNADKAADMLAKSSGLAKRGMLVYIPDAVDVSNGIFEENYAVKPGAATTSFARTFTANNPSTVCLPFAVDVVGVTGGTFYEFKDFADGKTVKFGKLTGGKTTADKAYLYKPATDGKVTFTGAAIESLPEMTEGEADGLYGVYEEKVFTQKEADKDIYYGWSAGSFVSIGKGATLNPGRAYLKLTQTSGAKNNLKAVFDDETTGISEVDATAGDDNAPAYDLTGRRVSAGYKGIVIKNGKKMIK